MRCEQAFDWICSAVSAIHLSPLFPLAVAIILRVRPI